jgi:putative phosphoesterase
MNMKVGIISDTHDRLEMIRRAVNAFNDSGVDLVLHAGDYVSPFTVEPFKALKAKMIGVFGNNDGDKDFLRRRYGEIDAEIKGLFALVEADHMRIGLLHGHDGALLEALSQSEAIDVLVVGHTHHSTIARRGRMLLVNCGEASGYLSGKATIGILDTSTEECRLIELAKT